MCKQYTNLALPKLSPVTNYNSIMNEIQRWFVQGYFNVKWSNGDALLFLHGQLDCPGAASLEPLFTGMMRRQQEQN